MATIIENTVRTRDLTPQEFQEAIINKLHSKGEWLSFEHHVDSQGAWLICIVDVNKLLASFSVDNISTTPIQLYNSLEYLLANMQTQSPHLRTRITKSHGDKNETTSFGLYFAVSLRSSE